MTALLPLPTRGSFTFDDPLARAADLVAYRRRTATPILVVVGAFDRVTPSEAIKILQETTPFGDAVIALVEANPEGVVYFLEDRMRLATSLGWIEYALPFEGSPQRIIEALMPDRVINLTTKPERISLIPAARIKNRGQRTAPANPRVPGRTSRFPLVAPTDRVVVDGEPAVVLRVLASGRLLDLLVGPALKTRRRVPFVAGGEGGWCLPDAESADAPELADLRGAGEFPPN